MGVGLSGTNHKATFFLHRKMKKSGSLPIFLLLACFFETIEARCRENCAGILGLFSPLQIFGMALLVIVSCILACIKCYCKYKIWSKILSKREESGRVSNTNGNGTSREDSIGPIGGYYNGGFNGEPAGGYNLPSKEAQYPQQQYTNAINGPFTSRKDTGEPAGDYNLPPAPREAQYSERGHYFLSVGPIRGHNGGFNGEPAGGYNLPSIEAQYPQQQYTNAINGPFTSRNDTGEPAGDYNLPPAPREAP